MASVKKPLFNNRFYAAKAFLIAFFSLVAGDFTGNCRRVPFGGSLLTLLEWTHQRKDTLWLI